MTARVQGGRTATPNAPPANNSLAPGELYVEMATPLRLWTGVPTGVAASGTKLVIDTAVQAAANAGAVQKIGDTMTGPLVLAGPPTLAAQAANMAYVDTQSVSTFNTRKGVVTLTAADVTGAGGALLASPVFTGTPSLPTGTTAFTQAPGDNDTSIATTAFVTNATKTSGVTVGDIAPATPADGLLWFDSVGLQLYLRYDDGNSAQWVPTINPPAGAPLASPAFTGNPTAPTQPAGDNDTSIATTAFVQTAVAPFAGDVGRNLVMNGTFDVAQRGAGAWGASGYTLDRWRLDFALDTTTVNQTQYGDAQRTLIGDEAAINAMAVAVTGNAGAGAFTCVSQFVENVRRLAGKTVTISFWAHAAVSGSPKIGVAATQVFGTGGSPSATVLVNGTATPALTQTPTRYSVTLTYPSISGKTLGTNGDHYSRLALFFSSGATNNTFAGGIGVQSATFVLWGVQLEIAQPGQTAPSALAKRDPADELALCQRFYCVGNYGWWGYGGAGATIGSTMNFPVQMRTAPTVAVLSPGYANASAATATSTAFGLAAQATCTGTGGTAFTCNFTASADL